MKIVFVFSVWTVLCLLYGMLAWMYITSAGAQPKGTINPLDYYCSIPDRPLGARRLAYVRDLRGFARERFFALSNDAQDEFWCRLTREAGCSFINGLVPRPRC